MPKGHTFLLTELNLASINKYCKLRLLEVCPVMEEVGVDTPGNPDYGLNDGRHKYTSKILVSC